MIRAAAAALLIALLVAVGAADALGLGAPPRKTIPPDLVLDYISRARGVDAHLIVHWSGAARITRAHHRTRSFRFGPMQLRDLRRHLHASAAGFVHAPDGRVRDALFRLRRPSGRVGPFRRDSVLELLAFDRPRFADRTLPAPTSTQQRLLAYLDGVTRRHER